MDKNSCDLSEGLEKLWNIIIKNAPRVPISFCSEEAKVEYLHDAICDNNWAKYGLPKFN